MAINYTVLKSSIIFSTIWQEDSDTRVVWITMLAMRNKDGEIFSSIPGLAHAARVPIENVEAALKKFMEPDPYSGTKEYEGRRIEVIGGGWRLFNHEKIKAEAQAANRQVYMRDTMRDKRAEEKAARPPKKRHKAEDKEPSASYRSREARAVKALENGDLEGFDKACEEGIYDANKKENLNHEQELPPLDTTPPPGAENDEEYPG